MLCLRRSFGRVLAPAALAALLLAPAPALAAPEPEILSPARLAEVTENTDMPVRGRGCPPGSQVTLGMLGRRLAAVTADDDGAFAATVRVPQVTVDPAAEGGEVILEVACGDLRGGHLVVVRPRGPRPQLTIDRPAAGSRVVEGSIIRVSGRGCVPGRPVTVDMDLRAQVQTSGGAGGAYRVDVGVQVVDRHTRVSLTVRCAGRVKWIGLTIVDTDGTSEDPPGKEPAQGADAGGGPDRRDTTAVEPAEGEGDRDDQAQPAPAATATPTPAATPTPGDTPQAVTAQPIADQNDGGDRRTWLIAGALVAAALIIGGLGWHLHNRNSAQPTELD